MTALIEGSAVASYKDMWVHDIHYNGTFVYDILIDFTAASGNVQGVIENVEMANQSGVLGYPLVGIEVDGPVIIRDCTLVADDECIGIRTLFGEVSVHDNKLYRATIGIKSYADFAGIMIGQNLYDSAITTAFEDADVDVVSTKFADVKTATWDRPDVLVTSTGTARFYLQRRAFIIAASFAAGIAGTGTGSNIIDVNLNGTTLYPTQANRPTLAATETDSGLQGCGSMAAVGDYLTVDVDAVTATTPAAAVVATVFYVEMPVV